MLVKIDSTQYTSFYVDVQFFFWVRVLAICSISTGKFFLLNSVSKIVNKFSILGKKLNTSKNISISIFEIKQHETHNRKVCFPHKTNTVNVIQILTKDILMMISVEFFDYGMAKTNGSQSKRLATVLARLLYIKQRIIQQHYREKSAFVDLNLLSWFIEEAYEQSLSYYFNVDRISVSLQTILRFHPIQKIDFFVRKKNFIGISPYKKGKLIGDWGDA